MSIKVGDIIRSMVERKEGEAGPRPGHKGIVLRVYQTMGAKMDCLVVDWDPPVPTGGPSDNGQWSTNPCFVEKVGELEEITEEGLRPHQENVILSFLKASALFIDEGLGK